MMTAEEKKTRLEARRKMKKTADDQRRIIVETTQKPVASITITIEWRKSRMWGNNPHAEAQVFYKDGTAERRAGYTCSGCGYDKESTVISQVFNDFLKYKLYQKLEWEDSINGEKTDFPYGVSYYGGDIKRGAEYNSLPYYDGGVGTSCYYRIGKFIGGQFENVASFKTFDVFKYTDK